MISFIYQKAAVFAEFYAQVNYDQMIPALVILTCKRLGLGEKPASTILNLLENTKYVVSTAYGESKAFYSTDWEGHIFGTGQGSGASPGF